MSEAMDRSADELAPINKAAILLLAMGEDEAAKALNHIEPRQVQRVGAAMAALGGVDTRQVDSVVNHFLETVSGESDAGMGASDYFKKMLTGTPERPRTSSLVQRLFGGSRPVVGRLRWTDSGATAGYLLKQRPRLQAIMLAYLEPERAADVLLKLPDASARSRALMHLARLDSSAGCPAGLPVRSGVLGGRRMAATILACLDDVVSAAVMAGIRRADQALAEDIEAEQTRRRRGAAGPARAGRHEDPAVSEARRFARFHNRINDTLDAQHVWLKRLDPAIGANGPQVRRGTGNASESLTMLESPSADSAA